MYFPFFDSTLLILIPGILVAVWAQMKVKKAFHKWSKVHLSGGMTGAEMARNILNKNGLMAVPVREIAGELTDNYNPIKKTLNLSRSVYASDSVAAAGVAAHEAGHAIQHSKGYYALNFRNGFFPLANIGSMLAFPLFLAGWLLGQNRILMELGIWLFTGFVIFTIITLPVEFNASKRAVKILSGSGILNVSELNGVKEVLTAAALTYVASALSAILNLLRLVMLTSNRD